MVIREYEKININEEQDKEEKIDIDKINNELIKEYYISYKKLAEL